MQFQQILIAYCLDAALNYVRLVESSPFRGVGLGGSEVKEIQPVPPMWVLKREQREKKRKGETNVNIKSHIISLFH